MKKILRIAGTLVVWFLGLSVALALLYRFVPVPCTILMLQRCVEQKMSGRPMKLDKKWVPIERMSPNLPRAVATAEDQKFEEHLGFDFEAIEKAAKYNERHHGRRVRGASTISQQCAKNVFLWPSRSWARKGLEVYFTFLIEVCWSKERIMEVYLNVIEMGPGVYGAEAAAGYYFHEPAARLTREQAARIAAILPNPRRWSASKPTPYILRRTDWILSHMHDVDLKDLR
jgi:monofunctional biosynthetic peptidoglycan transglycosylase